MSNIITNDNLYTEIEIVPSLKDIFDEKTNSMMLTKWKSIDLYTLEIGSSRIMLNSSELTYVLSELVRYTGVDFKKFPTIEDGKVVINHE